MRNDKIFTDRGMNHLLKEENIVDIIALRGLFTKIQDPICVKIDTEVQVSQNLETIL